MVRWSTGDRSHITAMGNTKPQAKSALNKRVTDLLADDRTGLINRDTKFVDTCEAWYTEVERAADKGALAVNSLRNYRGYLDREIINAFTHLRNHEMRGYVVNRFLKRVHDTHSYATAKGVRNVLHQVCEFAVRNDAMSANPVKSAAKLARGDDDVKEIVGLKLKQRIDLLAKLETWVQGKLVRQKGRRVGRRALVWTDLPDLVRLMLATGIRIGELLALTGDQFYTDEQGHSVVKIDAHIIRVTGIGLVREEYRKGSKRLLILRLPQWIVPMLNARKVMVGSKPMFCNAEGTWLDPSNTIGRIGDAFKEIGYDWVTSHVFRKTVTNVLDEAGLPTTAIADQLGNSPAVVERHYRPRRSDNPDAVAALEGILTSDDDDASD